MVKDYNFFAEYVTELIPASELNTFLEDAEQQSEEVDLRKFTKAWMEEQFEKDLKKARESGDVSVTQAESMRANFSNFAERTTNLERTRYTSPDRNKIIDLNKFILPIEEREGTIVRTSPYAYRESEELKSRESFLKKRSADVNNTINQLSSKDPLLSGSISDYRGEFRRNKLKLENEINKERLKEALKNDKVSFDEEDSLNALTKLAKEKNVSWDRLSPAEISNAEKSLNLLALQTRLTPEQTRKKRDLEESLRRAKKDAQNVAEREGFVKNISERNSLKKRGKNLNNYEVQLLYENVQVKPRKADLIKHVKKDLSDVKTERDPSRLLAIENTIGDYQSAGRLSRLEEIELEKELYDARREVNKKITRDKRRDVEELKKILALKGKNVAGLNKGEVRRLAKEEGVSPSRTVADSPEELMVTVASYKTGSPSTFEKELKNLKKAYAENPEDTLKRLKNTHETFTQKEFPRLKPKNLYITREDVPSKYDEAKRAIPSLRKQDYEKIKKEYIPSYLKSLNLTKQDRKLLDDTEINKKVIGRLIREETGIPVMDEEIENRYKEKIGVPVNKELSLDQRRALKNRIEKASKPGRSEKDNVFLNYLASKTALPKRTVVRDGKEIVYKPDPEYVDFIPKIPGVGEEDYFGVERKRSLDFRPFKLKDVRNYVERLNEQISAATNITTLKLEDEKERTLKELEKLEQERIEKLEQEGIKKLEQERDDIMNQLGDE